MKKSYVSLLLGATLLCSAVLAGCGSSGAAPKSNAGGNNSGAAKAGKYPEKAVQLVVPWAPGGGSDLSGRILSKYVTESLGQQLVVSNVEGASGKTGQLDVMQAQPDGYKLLWEHQCLHMALATGRSDFGWDDYVPIICPIEAVSIMVTGKDMPFDDAQGLISYAKENPGKINFGVADLTTSHFAFLSFIGNSDAETTDYNLVSMGGDTSRITAILQKTMDVTTVTLSSALPYIESGDLKVIGIMSEERLDTYADYPTLKEQGIDAINKFNYVVYVPKGTPEDIVNYLTEVFRKTAENPDFQKEVLENNFVPVNITGDALTDMLKADSEIIQNLATEYSLVK